MQGSLEKATQTIPKSKGVGSSRADRSSGSGPIPAARHSNSQQSTPFYANPSPNPGQPGYASGQVPVQGLGQGPTDPRRAPAASAAAPASSLSGQIPPRFGGAGVPPTANQFGELSDDIGKQLSLPQFDSW